MNVATASPVEIDSQLAELHEQHAQKANNLARLYVRVHQLLGEQSTRSHAGHTLSWPTSDEQAERALRDTTFTTLDDAQTRDRVLESIAGAHTLLDSTRSAIDTLEYEFDTRGGWSRFFTVDEGHIHSSLVCAGGTIRPTTRVSWNPALSGRSVDDAVAELGPALCTHCYPSAPVAQSSSVVESRERRERRVQREADKAAKAATAAAKSITTPDGSALFVPDVVGQRQVKTVTAARRVAIDAAFQLMWYDADHPGAQGWNETVELCVAALAHKRGTTVADELSSVQERARAKYRRETR